MGKFSYRVLFRCLQPLMDLPRFIKRFVSLWVDACILFVSWVLAYYLRFDTFEILNDEPMVLSFVAVVLVTLIVFSLLGLYRAVVRYIGLRSMFAMGTGAIVSGFLLKVVSDSNAVLYSVSVILNYVFFAFAGIAGSRILLRELVTATSRNAQHRVLILSLIHI